MEILDDSQWYIQSGRLEAGRASACLTEKENQAIRRGFAGLRLAEDTSWLGEEDWGAFAEYEAAVARVIGKRRVIAACGHPLGRRGVPEIVHVVENHQVTLTKDEGRWRVIEGARREHAEGEILESEEKYRLLFEGEGDAIIAFDAETLQFEGANKAALSLYGYTREEFLVLSYSAILAEIGKSGSLIQHTLAAEVVWLLREFYRKREEGEDSSPIDLKAVVEQVSYLIADPKRGILRPRGGAAILRPRSPIPQSLSPRRPGGRT